MPRKRRCTLGVAAALFALSVAIDGIALDPSRSLTQARLSVWTQESGLPQNTVGAIVQTRDGYLWFGTEEGLVRFDGVRFVISDRQNAPALRSAFISSLFEASDGTLWIGTYGGGLSRLRGGRIEAFRPDLLGADRIREMHGIAGGAIFVATAGGGVLRIDGEKLTRFTTRDGLPTDRIWAIEDDGSGGLWIATFGGGVVRWRDSRVTQRITSREGLPDDSARALLRDPDGTLWIGTDGGGVAAWRNGSIVKTLTVRDGLPSDLIRSLQRDHDGNLWIGTDGGLARWRGDDVEPFGAAEGLPSPVIRTTIEDREGSLWVGTTAGLVRLRDTRFLSLTRKQGLPVEAVRPIVEDLQGRIWGGTDGGGLCKLLPAPVECLSTRQGLPHDSVYALASARDGSIWIGTDGGGVIRLRDGSFSDVVDTRRGLPNNRVRALVENPDGSLWVSTTAGLALVRDGNVSRIKELTDRQLRPLLSLGDGTLFVGTDGAGLWRVSGGVATVVATSARGLESDRIFSLTLAADKRGVWIGPSGGGLARLELASGSVRSLTRRDGLHDDVVFQIVDDGTDLWLTSNRGLYRVGRDRVITVMSGKKVDLGGTVYGTTEGMPSGECNAASPAATIVRDGRLWVATARGFAVIDPRVRARNEVPPPVHVEEVVLDGVVTDAAHTRALRIPPGTQRTEVRYTATSLGAPERVTFRYMLEGYDRSWVEAGASRVAHYTRLAPGTYTFRVTATNEDGVASAREARIGVKVDPRWFETWWARLVALLLAAAAIWGAMRLRIAAALEDKNRQLAIANERLRNLSYIDGLTGVANRRRFDEALDEACAAKGAAPLSLVLLDLDHFKLLNDSQGHQQGDVALRTVASLLAEQSEARGGLVARFGGEEFAWLLPGVALDDAKREAEMLRLKVRSVAIPHDRNEPGIVTASLGVSSGTTPFPPRLVVNAADAALYRAKSAGRDRVEAEPIS